MAVVVEETITEADVRVVMAEAEVEAGQMVAQDKMIQQIFLALFRAMLVIKVLAVMVVAVVVVALQTELLIQRLLVMVAHRQIIIIQLQLQYRIFRWRWWRRIWSSGTGGGAGAGGGGYHGGGASIANRGSGGGGGCCGADNWVTSGGGSSGLVVIRYLTGN